MHDKMSRRKQGRPQQRKALDTLEQENDLLVCGDCQTSFALHDIVHFIKHKKKCCDKENVISDGGSCRKDSSNGGSHNNDDEDKDDDVDSEIESDDGGDEDVGEKNDENADDKEEKKKRDVDADVGVEKERNNKDVHRKPLKQKQVVDAESNTTHSEPSRFVCETCRSTYTSAWGLLQHAQKEHGMKIYTSPSTSSSSSSSSTGRPSSSTPGPNNASPIDLVMSSSRSAMGRRPASNSGAGGCDSPYPVVHHPPNPFASPFRLPLGDGRLPHPTSLSPFSRPSMDFDLINDTRLRPQYLGRGLHGLEHSPFYHSPFDRTRAHIPQSVEDYYSMRLRQLASSPGQAQVKPFLNNLQAQVPPVAVTPTSKSERPASAEAPSASSPRLSSLATALSRPQKPKACEFCGKSFRFKSNLIVHRRSHTGEKPFKCPMCPHACTQQSKLKRHMKTHSAKSENTEGGTSPGGTPYPKVDDFEDDEEDEDEEEEEELEGEDEENMEEEMNDEERAVLESMKKSESQSEAEPGEIRGEGKGIKRELSDTKDDVEEDCEPSDLSMKKPRSSESLLSEVMKNTGLNSIQTYSEAYQAALAESQENDKLVDTDKVSLKSEKNKEESETPRSSSPKSPRLNPDKMPEKDDKSDGNDRLFLGGTDLLGKSDKKTSSSPASAWNASVESLAPNPIESAASMFSRMQQSWFHPDSPVRFFLPGYPARFPPAARDLSLSRENHGLNLSPTTTNSALSSTSPTLPTLFKSSANNSRGSSSAGNSPTSSLLLPSNGGGGGGGGNNSISPLKKESRRNDTCEYCGKIFKNCSNLTVHRRSHTGEKPYKCGLCSYACAQSSKLTRHMKTHGRQGKDVYTCKFCNMPFSVPSTLEKHMRKCVENRQARILAADGGDLSSEASNGEVTPTADDFSSPHLVNPQDFSSPHLVNAADAFSSPHLVKMDMEK